jgi:hypothetical protein
MAVYDLYSKRRARDLGGVTDVYQYDQIPPGLRTQIIHIWGDAIGIPYVTKGAVGTVEIIQGCYHRVVQILRREYRVFALTDNRHPNEADRSLDELKTWFISENDTDRVLDAVEITAQVIERLCSRNGYIASSRRDSAEICKNAIEELNTRFKENGVGYQYTDGSIIRLDSQLIHTAAVLPALAILRAPEFKNAQEEFLSAFEHYRHGKHEEALVDCCKSFESTMKVICAKRRWPFDPNKSTASELIKTCLDNGLIPPYWDNHFTGLRTMLTSGIPTARNRQGGHGAGTAINSEPPSQLVSYVLHMTASTILFLAESEKALSPTS